MRFLISIFLALGFFMPTHAYSAEPLSDEKLDNITAGNAHLANQNIQPIRLEKYTSNGTHIVVDGDAQLLTSNQNNQLLLSDNAQQNLNSLININAVNAPINVLLNLNINIDSVVENLQQFNVLNGDILPKQ